MKSKSSDAKKSTEKTSASKKSAAASEKPSKAATAEKASAKSPEKAPAKSAEKAPAKTVEKTPAKSAEPEKPEKPVEPALKKKELKRFEEILLEKKQEILKSAKRTLNEDMTIDSDDLADEMDLASSEYLQSWTFRLRGREKFFLKKINHALGKIENGTFGVCESCDEPITLKRLEARPETTLCIRCKEDQERMEKAYG